MKGFGWRCLSTLCLCQMSKLFLQELVKKVSEANAANKPSVPMFQVPGDSSTVHHYSTQTLNTTAATVRAMQQALSESPPGPNMTSLYTYGPFQSLTLPLVDETRRNKEQDK